MASPSSTVSGNAGGYASFLAVRQLPAIGLCMLIAVVGFSVTAAAVLSSLPTGFAVVGAGVAFCAIGAASPHLNQMNKASIGATSERRVAKVLNSSGAAMVLHGKVIGKGGDADHIIAGPILAVVETKTGGGNVTVTADGSVFAGRRRIPNKPISQVNFQRRNLTKLTGVTASAIICVPDMTNPPFTSDGVVLCSLRDLPGVLAAAPRVITSTNLPSVRAALSR